MTSHEHPQTCEREPMSKAGTWSFDTQMALHSPVTSRETRQSPGSGTFCPPRRTNMQTPPEGYSRLPWNKFNSRQPIPSVCMLNGGSFGAVFPYFWPAERARELPSPRIQSIAQYFTRQCHGLTSGDSPGHHMGTPVGCIYPSKTHDTA